MIPVLVTGGAGYIGSHTLRALEEAGFNPVVYDNFSRGHRGAVGGYTAVEGDTADREKLLRVIGRYSVGAVIHFAAHSRVGESVENPALYYNNNVVGSLVLLGALLEAGVKHFIFSSSAAVYGEPKALPIDEGHPLRPANPYGETKLVVENALRRYGEAYGLRYCALRYFNAAGAAPSGLIGEDHDPETHLVPLVLQNLLGTREEVTIFGGDYSTRDGTAIRDYVHVEDLADAHVLSLQALLGGAPSAFYNLGSERGYSVLEVIAAAEKVTGMKADCRFGPRRAGDPAVLVASASRAKRELGWRPRRGELKAIIESAWRWHRGNPRGYAGREG